MMSYKKIYQIAFLLFSLILEASPSDYCTTEFIGRNNLKSSADDKQWKVDREEFLNIVVKQVVPITDDNVFMKINDKTFLSTDFRLLAFGDDASGFKIAFNYQPKFSREINPEFYGIIAFRDNNNNLCFGFQTRSKTNKWEIEILTGETPYFDENDKKAPDAKSDNGERFDRRRLNEKMTQNTSLPLTDQIKQAGFTLLKSFKISNATPPRFSAKINKKDEYSYELYEYKINQKNHHYESIYILVGENSVGEHYFLAYRLPRNLKKLLPLKQRSNHLHRFITLERDRLGVKNLLIAFDDFSNIPEGDIFNFMSFERNPLKDVNSNFILNGKNPTNVIEGLNSINGLPISALETRMRPGRASDAGLLGKEERLLDILAQDNEFILGKGLTHQAIGIQLIKLCELNFDYKEYEDVYLVNQFRGGDFPHAEFTWHGIKYLIEITSSRGRQESPFEPVSDKDRIPNGMHDEPKGTKYFRLHNLDNGKSFSFSELVAYLIFRYGFYEGKKTSSRVDPKVILEVLPWLESNNKD